MAGELIVKNGLRVSGSTIISGSISATSFTGSFSGSITSAVSASYAATASVLLGSVTSASFASTSSFPWFQTGSNIAYNGGNVGIGNNTPTNKLTVAGTISGSNEDTAAGQGVFVAGGGNPAIVQRLQRTSGGYAYSIFQGYADNLTSLTSSKILDYGAFGNLNSGTTPPSINYSYFGVGTGSTYNNTHLRIYDDANKTVYIDGNLGIGITSPSSKLQVQGLSILFNSAGSSYNENLRLPEATGGYASIVMGGPVATSGTGTTVWTLVKHPSSNSHRFSIRNNNTDHITVLTSGNVGIGTSAPTGSVHIRGGGGGATTLADAITNSILRLDYTSNPGFGTYFGAINSGGGAYQYIQSGWSPGPTAYNLSLNPYGGNVGIGTTVPANRFHIKGAGTTSSTTALRIEDANTSASLVVLDNGYVGIGTTTPPDQLSVGKSTGTSISITSNFAAGSTVSPLNLDLNFRGYADGKVAMIRSWDEASSTGNGSLTFWTNQYIGSNIFTEKMRIGPTGNVGIGTSSPSSKLDVSGSGRFTNGLTVTGSVIATSFTGSLSGSVTAAISASYALSSSFSSTASFYGGSVTSASFAATASSVNALSQSVLISGSLRALTLEPTNISTNYFPKKSGTFLTSSVLNSSDDVTLNWGPATIVPTTPNSREFYIWGLNYASLVLRVSGSTGNDGYTMQARPGGNFAFSNIANNTQIFTLGSDVAVTALSILGAGGSIGMGQNGGNVGINWPNIYTIPAKFYVSGSVRFDGATTINGTGTTSATTAFSVNNANASSSLVVRDDRRVGINTTTPGATLEVNGNMIISGGMDLRNSGGIRLYDSSGFGGGRIFGSYSYLAGEIFIQPLASSNQNFIFSPNNGMSIGGFTIGGTAGSPPAYGLAISGSVGIGTRVPAFKLDVSGSGRFTNGLTVTGSVIGTSFTGSLSGSATNAVSASFATTASYWSGSILNATSASFASTASYYGGSVSTASYALTAGAVTTLNQDVTINGSLTATGSITFDSLNGNNGPVKSLFGALTSVTGYTGIVTINTAPPVNFDIQDGIIVNVF